MPAVKERALDEATRAAAAAIEAWLYRHGTIGAETRERLREALAAFLRREGLEAETGAPPTLCYVCEESFRPDSRRKAAAALCPKHEGISEEEKRAALRRRRERDDAEASPPYDHDEESPC